MLEWLLAAAGSGLLYVLLLLLGCFACVHAGRLAILGWRAIKPSPPKESEKEPEKPEDAQKQEDKKDEKSEPVYLLVEKKWVKKKPKYKEPKRVEVKKQP